MYYLITKIGKFKAQPAWYTARAATCGLICDRLYGVTYRSESVRARNMVPLTARSPAHVDMLGWMVLVVLVSMLTFCSGVLVVLSWETHTANLGSSTLVDVM